ncbi:hypothetical protein [Sutcliffiella deserti]|uniref:hypothetical protein n=1 Tax=Sutcliffiella deserti TaxID=2875501 RepID=UPI001CC04A22|nr:hypothetical protein [Sutcliffiella deserti]
MRKMNYYIMILVILGIGYSVFYINSYSIKNTNESVESSLKDWLNRGETRQLNPILIEKVRIDDTTTHIGLFQLENNNIGYVRLVEGVNGRLKITNTGHGTGELQYQDIETNKGLYYILVGENTEKKIHNIRVELMYEDYNFNVDVSTEDRFIRYHKLPIKFEKPYPAEITVLDKENNVIE